MAIIDIPFTKGLDESADETVTALPAMTELVNYRLTRAGRLEHRLGVRNVDLSATLINAIGSRPNGNLTQGLYGRFLAAGGHGFVYTGIGDWAAKGTVPRFAPWQSYLGLGDSVANYSGASCASVFGCLAVGGRNASNTLGYAVRIFDELTGTMVWSGFSGDPTGGGSPENIGRLVACGTSQLVAVTMRNDTGKFMGATMDLAVLPYTGFPDPPTTIVTAAGAAGYGFDAAPRDSTSYLISYYTGSGARIARVDSTAHTIISSATLATTGAAYTTCLTVGTTHFLCWMDQSNQDIRLAVFDSAMAQIGTTQVVGTATSTALSNNRFHPVLVSDGGTGVYVGWTDSYVSGVFATYRTSFRQCSAVPALGTTYGPYYATYLASKPFISSTAFVENTLQPAVWLANYDAVTSEVDRSYFLVTLGVSTDQKIVFEMSASGSPSNAALVGDLLGPALQVSEVPQSTTFGQRFRQVALPESFRGLGTANPQKRLQVYRFGDSTRSVRSRARAIVPCGGSFVVLGGAPRYYDGAWLNELGFAHGPVIANATPGATGGMTAGATYRYVFVLEYFDALGQRQVSFPSSPVSVTLGGADGQVNLEILVPGIWATGNNAGIPATAEADPRHVVVRAYRTAANVGTVYRYAPATAAPNGAAAGPFIANGRVSYQDTNSDVAISVNEPVYVQRGNTRSNYRAPPCRFGCEHEGRLVVAGGWNPCEFRFSKLFFPGEGIQFSDDPAFTGVCPEPITGTASLDGSLVLFAERSIYVVSGDGPLDDGSGSFGTPRRLPGRTGCKDWRSVVMLPDGVYFRAADGLYLLPRGLASPVFVGSAIKESLRAFPETLASATITRPMTSAVGNHDSEQVVAWLVGDAEEPTQTAIFMLSLTTNTWSRVVLPNSNGNPQTVMGYWQELRNGTDFENGADVLGFARATLNTSVQGSLLVENVGTAYDRDIDDNYEPLLSGTIKTGKVFPFGFGGRGRVKVVRLVGECLSATTLTPTVVADSDLAGYTSDPLVFTPGRFAVEIPIRRPDLKWFQVTLQDPTTGAANRGAGLRLNGLAIEVEGEGGMARTEPGRRSG